MSSPNAILHELLNLAEIMLTNGAEVSRVEETLNRMGHAYGATQMNVFAITSSIVVTMVFEEGEEYTQTRRITTPVGTDFFKLEQANALSRQCCATPLSLTDLKDEINKILERFKDDDVFTCAFITACYTGMRTGEVCSLTWDDIDFESRIINVKHTVYDKPDDGKGRWYMGTTKTKNGTRQIYMSPTLYQALMNFKKKQQYLKILYGANYITYYFEDIIGKNGKLIEKRIIENTGNILHMNTANLVFTRPNGKYVGRNILNYPFKIIHKELGIEDCRFYDLRGSYATTNLRNGVEIRDVADILGHKYVETTENFYISSTEEDKKDVTTAFDKVMTSDLINDIIKYEIAY